MVGIAISELRGCAANASERSTSRASEKKNEQCETAERPLDLTGKMTSRYRCMQLKAKCNGQSDCRYRFRFLACHPIVRWSRARNKNEHENRLAGTEVLWGEIFKR